MVTIGQTPYGYALRIGIQSVPVTFVNDAPLLAATENAAFAAPAPIASPVCP